MESSDPSSREDEYFKLSRSELWSQLANAINLRSSQDQVLWTIFGTFWAANAILLVALFTSGTLPSDPFVGIVVATVGILLSLTWHSIQNRALGHLMRHEKLITKIESSLGFDPDFAVSADLNRVPYDAHLRKGLKARSVMRACSIGGTVMWLLALSSFLANLFV